MSFGKILNLTAVASHIIIPDRKRYVSSNISRYNAIMGEAHHSEPATNENSTSTLLYDLPHDILLLI